MVRKTQITTNGKELAVLSGALVVHIFVPFGASRKTVLDAEARKALEALLHRIDEKTASLKESAGMKMA
ncbi:MAG: hypothetical protein AAF725_08680, partial [Acidobacteriota bacterium]